MDKVRLGDYIVVKTGKLDANAADENGMYPFFTCSQTPLRINDYAFDCECVLIAGNGDLNVKYYNGKFNAYQRTYVITATKEINMKYLYHFFDFYIEKLRQQSIGGVIKYIKLNNLTDIRFNLYDLPTQQKIVKELDCLSDIIEKKKKQLSDFDELIKSKFVEMFASAPSKKIEDVCSSFKIGPFGSALHKNEIVKEGFAFVLGTDNAVKNEFSFDEIRYIDKDKYQQLESYAVKPGDIIMSMMGTVGRVAIIPDNLGVAVISSHLCILRVNKQYIYPEFFHVAFCKDENIQHQISDIHNGSIMKGFNLKIVKAFKIKCPSLEEQLKFLSFKKLIDKSKLEVQQSIDETQNLFNERMQHYFGVEK